MCLCNPLGPNVAGMKEHEHWHFIRDLFSWCGYSLRFARNVNLSEMAQQNRDRLILIATLDSADLQPHLCRAFPSIARLTLESFDCLMPMSEPWVTQTRIPKDVLRCLDSSLSLSSQRRKDSDTKRLKRDMELCRLRFPEGQFGCIMASYGYSHLLPTVNLRCLGLFGTLLVTPESIRFLAIPEVLMLM